MLLSPIASANVFEETFSRLVNVIKLGVLPPGSRFPSERELAEGLQVSRTTLREALRTLEHVGYVETRRGRSGGTFVTDKFARGEISTDIKKLAAAMGEDLNDALDLRWALESSAAALAARRRTDDDIIELRDRWERCRQVEPDQFRVADLNFHLSIAKMTHTESIARVVGDVRMRLAEILAAIPVVPASVEHSHEQHREIMEAIIAQDETAARTAMEQHVAATAEILLALSK
ncbi:hypothetical protein A5727_16860 [Mycobacterium sp. ACS4331]|nr:hypothetical protein A5727_16860 [Mycobacterium sp. ACS4331]